jgi:SAM-dependent methyltransferase
MGHSLRRRVSSPRVEVLGLADRASHAHEWIPDTRLGAWLLSTDAWRRYVIQVALLDLIRLLGDRSRAYPSILDVGCGAGRALPLLDRLFKPGRLVGVDPDPTALARAVREAERCRCPVELRCGVATSLDLGDASTDMVFCHQTMHHLADPDGAVLEFHRVLRPGGVLLFAESCAPFIRSIRVRMLFRHPLHAQKTADGYLHLLHSAGFQFNRDNVSMPSPWWSRPDLGLFQGLGGAAPKHRATALNVAASRECRAPDLPGGDLEKPDQTGN